MLTARSVTRVLSAGRVSAAWRRGAGGLVNGFRWGSRTTVACALSVLRVPTVSRSSR
jgi:hypothetical protein